jgi:hypothetical protein
MPEFITDTDEIYKLFTKSHEESIIWRRNYQEFERLADNELIADLDPSLPEVNDGSLAAALYKLPKRIVSSNLDVKFKALDCDDAWVSELANIVWNKQIVPNANSQAPFFRKLKDAVRKAAIYGSVPLITLFVERGNYEGADFIVAQPQDVKFEPGKVSDYDSDLLFWEIYFTKQQVRNLIDRAEEETKDKKTGKDEDDDSYNKWNIPLLKQALADAEEDTREQRESHNDFNENASLKPSGIKFIVTQQRGVDAPFFMYYNNEREPVRQWSNQDPSGDMQIHMLYCYQDFINPYGVGIVKLAGGTQNVLDYMRQADVLATQIGLRPPVKVGGDMSNTDLDSMVYEQDAQWIIGAADVERLELSSNLYEALPNRVEMYQSSLNKLIPTGDTSVSSEAGDPTQSKTPQGVKAAQESLSIDDEDFKDNFYLTLDALIRSMINIHFANMQGTDLLKLDDEERDRLMKAGLQFPLDENNQPTNQLEVIWDNARATFECEIDPSDDKTQDDKQKLDGLTSVAEMLTNPQNMQLIASPQPIIIGSKKLDPGELFSEIISLATDNDKILQDIQPEEKAQMEQQQAAAPAGAQDQQNQQQQPKTLGETVQWKPGDLKPDERAQALAQVGIKADTSSAPTPNELIDAHKAAVDTAGVVTKQHAATKPQTPPAATQTAKTASKTPAAKPQSAQTPSSEADIIQGLMTKFSASEPEAKAMRAAELQGYPPEEILSGLQRARSGGAAK